MNLVGVKSSERTTGEMKLFCSDLDNTLIYSWRRPLAGDKRCVEWLKGQEISFVTERTLDLLREVQKKALFIPVTTRRVDQYERLSFPGISPQYALTCNGGVLLEHGEVAEDWYRESLELVEVCRGEMERGRKLFLADPFRCFDVWFVQELFLFTKSENIEETLRRLREVLDLDKLEVLTNKDKVYLLPKVLNKGAAVERIRKRLEAEWVFAAGDSAFDVPMLEKADLGYWGGTEPFAEEMLEYFLRKMRE